MWFNHGLGCCHHPARRDVLLQRQVSYILYIQMLKDLNTVSIRIFSQHKACVCSFFWRSYPQSRSPQQSLITNFWPSAPVNIDAAYESQQSDRIFFFKGMCSLYLTGAQIWHYFKFLFSFLMFFSIQVAKCGPSEAIIQCEAILKDLQVLVFQKPWRKSMLLFMTYNLAKLYSLLASITSGEFKVKIYFCF